MRTCPHCGADQPDTFDTYCTACRRPLEESAKLTAAIKAPTARVSETAAASTSITSAAPRPALSAESEVAPRVLQRCPRCDAEEIIQNVRVTDASGQGVDATAYMNPDALVFSGGVSRPIMARVCGSCGHVEFHVVGPQELMDAAALAPERYGVAAARRAEGVAENTCLNCGAVMAEDVSTCAACGWSYVSSEQIRG